MKPLEMNTKMGSLWSALRQQPANENEIARMQMLRASGKSPRNPKWYSPPRTPKTFKFKAGAAPVFPSHVRPNTISKPTHIVLPCMAGPFNGESLDVSEFGRLSTLVFAVAGHRGYYERTVNNTRLTWVPVPANPTQCEDLV